jgi:hypothetical protein
MTHQAAYRYAPGLADAAGQIGQFRQILSLVDEVAGRGRAHSDPELDEAARISVAYENAPPVAQRRFDAIAEETERWAAAAVETLLRLRDQDRPHRAAAGRLAAELRLAIKRMKAAVRG